MTKAMTLTILTIMFLLTLACSDGEYGPVAGQTGGSEIQQPAVTKAPRGVQYEAQESNSSRTTKGVPSEPEQNRQATDTTFRDYGRLEFTESAVDNVSTFSLDIDRTSYNLALNWARHGYQVEPASVRAEEWINAFNYQYDPPQSDTIFSITTSLFRHPLEDGLHMARIGFQAPELQEAQPLNVTLVLDASGSMQEGNRVETARAAAETIRNSLSENDRIAVVHFNTDVKRDLTVEHRQPNDQRVRRSIDRLQPGGSTNVQAGLDQGVQLADQARHDRPDAHNYIILMSDGVANVDATNPFAILESVNDPDTTNPLRIITIGVGIENYNDVLLEQIAQHGNGWYRYLDDPQQAEATFARENWLALSTPFADHTRAQVTWDPDIVRNWRIVGYENRVTSDESFHEERREFAEIHSGASTTVFYELELSPNVDSILGTRPIATAELRWTAAGTQRAENQHHTFLAVPVTGFNDDTDPLTRLGSRRRTVIRPVQRPTRLRPSRNSHTCAPISSDSPACCRTSNGTSDTCRPTRTLNSCWTTSPPTSRKCRQSPPAAPAPATNPNDQAPTVKEDNKAGERIAA